MRQLLLLPAPMPRSAVLPPGATAETKEVRPPNFYNPDNAPPDDALLEDLLDYWTRWGERSGRPVPSDTTKKRLLEACASDIQRLPPLIALFSYDESTSKTIKELYDQASSEQLLDEYYLDKIKKWLVFNSKFFLNDLYALASKVKDNVEGGNVRNDNALVALARVDWQTAESLVQSLADGNQPRSSALAVSLLYRQAISTKDSDVEEKYRKRLKTIASDRTAPASARDTSIDALSLTDWSGRDDWYLSLLADDSLRELFDGSSGYTPLMTLFDRDPDKWIPVMTRLVESKDRAVQQAAASCLVNYATFKARRDAILPVLRWLSDPAWLEFRGSRRAWFMQTMSNLDMPESVPGLIWIIENEPDNSHWAARTLAHYKDPRAVPVLKKALLQSNEEYRRLILRELIPAGGLPDSEAVAALEDYAAMRMTPEGREQVDRSRSFNEEPLPLPVSIGKYLTTIIDVPGSLARSVLARAESLKKTNPAMAESLLTIANKWRSRDIDLDMIHRIADGTADANTLATALSRSADLRETVGGELQILLQRSDEVAGIGAVFLNDSQMAQTILSSGNKPAQIGLLASARLTQTPLAVELVGKLLSNKNPLLALAAERYLLAEDSKEARKLLWQHHPEQAFVTGWRENVELLGGDNVEGMAKEEEKLRAELFKEEGPLEILALVSNHTSYSRVLRIFANKAVYTHYEDEARYRERVVSKAELANFKEFVTTAGLSNSGPVIEYCHHNCWLSEFVSLRKDEAWRVFSQAGSGNWNDIPDNFELLLRGEGMKIHYELEKQIKGLEVLYTDEVLQVKDVWQRGDEVRIFVERLETEEEMKARYADRGGEDDEGARAERRRQAIAQEQARFSWRKLIGDKAADMAAQPENYTSFDESKFPPDDASRSSDNEQRQLLNADTLIIAHNFDGLWKQVAGRKAVRISEGAYAYPVITPDGKWVVTAKADGGWSRPNYAIRFNLQTGREFRVKLDPSDDLRPIAFLPLHDRVLLRRGHAEYDVDGNPIKSDPPEYYLLDAATGATQLVSGEFTPLLQEGTRFLQPAAQPNEYWAAIPDKNQTQVGRYNLKDFTFKPVLTVPHISFESMSMWVDESHNKLYVVYKSELLRLPLKPAGDQPR